jgi:hypothetical protein
MLHTAPNWCKYGYLAVLFGSSGNSYTFYMQECVYFSQHVDNGRAKEIKITGTGLYAACHGNLSMCHFGHARHSFVSPGIDHFIHGIVLNSGFQTFYFNNSLLIRVFMINHKGVGHSAIFALQMPLCLKGLILTMFKYYI